MIIREEKRWDAQNSSVIDDDIKKEVKGFSLLYGDIINMQLIKELP